MRLITVADFRNDYYVRWHPTQPQKDRSLDVEEFQVPAVIQLDGEGTKSDPIRIQIIFQRRIQLAIISVYFPSSLIVMICSVSFWIDPQAVPGRVTLLITSLLALLTQLLSVRSTIPKVSYITSIDAWFFICLSFVSVAFFIFAISYTNSMVSLS